MSTIMGPIEAEMKQRLISARARIAAASHPAERIAELEGMVRQLRADVRDRDEQIDRLKAIPRNRASVIIEQVCDKHQVTPGSLRSPRRDREVALARHEACYRLRTELDMSLPAIGRLLGDRDHTTILNSVNVYAKTIGGAA